MRNGRSDAPRRERLAAAMASAAALAGAGRGLLLPPVRDAGPVRVRDCVVCVPARDEARRLPRLLGALGRQRGLDGGRLRVVLLINNSVDASVSAAHRAAALAPRIELRCIEREFPAERAHAGSARGAAMEAGAAWLASEGIAGGVLLTTDADAVPDPDWAASSCAALGAGADVAAAALDYDPREMARLPLGLRDTLSDVLAAQSLAVALEAAIDPVPEDPAPRHWDHSGGGLALRLVTFRAVGGCPAVPYREDLALVEAVRRAGGGVRHCPSIRVVVSARRRGRAAGGMAATLQDWGQRTARGETIRVPDPAVQEAHWRDRAVLRADIARAAAALPPSIARRIVAAGIARRCPDPVDWPLLTPLPDAIRQIRQRLETLKGLSNAA